MADRTARLVAVYRSERTARAAVDAAIRAGAAPNDVRIDDDLDAVVSLEGEMREEMEHTFVGPGNVGPFTKEMSKGMLVGIAVGAVIGLVAALPFAAIRFGGWGLGARVVLLAICGAFVGSTVGWVVGGAFAARRPGERLAAERGVTVTAPATRSIERAMAGAAPIRLDVVDAGGQPVGTVTTEEGSTAEGIPREIGKHMGNERRDS